MPVQSNCYHSYSRPLTTATSKTRAVRFVMKLPRYNPQPSTAAAGALRGDDQKNLHEDDEKVTLPHPPRQQQQQQPRRHSGSSASLTRRCQSANAVTRTRPRTSFLPDMTKSRSHSQEPLRRRVGGGINNKTEALPITPTGQAARPEGEGVGASGANVDKGDLTRMYDYATWNMYERIVTARRRRLANIDQETISSTATTSSSRRSSDVPSESSSPRSSNQEDSSGSVTTGQQGTEVVYTTVPTKQSSSRPSQPQSSTLKNSSSHDDSTMATADETDKSSTASSSWSRTDSPAQFPFLANGNGIVPFPSLQRPVSCPPSGEHQASSGEDEHFIFPMDM